MAKKPTPKPMPHDDAAMDRTLVKKMVKPIALTGKKCGGKVKRGK
jgi:hypothetical protein